MPWPSMPSTSWNDKLIGVCGENTDKGAWEKVVLAGVIGAMVSAETGRQVAKD